MAEVSVVFNALFFFFHRFLFRRSLIDLHCHSELLPLKMRSKRAVSSPDDDDTQTQLADAFIFFAGTQRRRHSINNYNYVNDVILSLVKKHIECILLCNASHACWVK